MFSDADLVTKGPTRLGFLLLENAGMRILTSAGVRFSAEDKDFHQSEAS